MAEVQNIATLLRAWRGRVAPESAGLAEDHRRTPGLRREELATLAGVSIDYIVRLEQGRATRPSAQVLGALSRALHLGRDEIGMLYRSAGLNPPVTSVDRRVPESIERLVGRLDAFAVGVYSADWWLLRWNPRWTALLGDPVTWTGRDRNLVWQVFVGVGYRAAPADRPVWQFQEELVADLRLAASDHSGDEQLAELVAALREASEAFESQWGAARAAPHRSEHKRIRHPHGDLTLDCDVLTVAGTDTKVLVYSAPPGTPDAELLQRITAPDPHTVR